MSIQRTNLRNQIRDELLTRMRDGRAQPGESINEVQLAAELGVSRTPLREALVSLESSGQVASTEGKGFCFLPLSEEELENLALILAHLEGLALELTPAEDLSRIGAELRESAAAFSEDSVSLRTLAVRDDAWHTHMLGSCRNLRLLDIIENTRQAFHRYESLILQDEALVGRMASEHVAIAESLVRGDVEGAKAALAVNWQLGAQRVSESASNASHAAPAS